MTNRSNFADHPDFTPIHNPEPVLKEENPGVLLIVNGKFIPADKYVNTLRVNTHLALKWVDELRQRVQELEAAMMRQLDALPLDVLREYVEEKDAIQPYDSDEEV